MAEPALLPTAVKQLLRFESPLQLNNRLPTAPRVFGGQSIAAGSFITWAIGAANRDESMFEHADRLDLARRPNN